MLLVSNIITAFVTLSLLILSTISHSSSCFKKCKVAFEAISVSGIWACKVENEEIEMYKGYPILYENQRNTVNYSPDVGQYEENDVTGVYMAYDNWRAAYNAFRFYAFDKKLSMGLRLAPGQSHPCSCDVHDTKYWDIVDEGLNLKGKGMLVTDTTGTKCSPETAKYFPPDVSYNFPTYSPFQMAYECADWLIKKGDGYKGAVTLVQLDPDTLVCSLIYFPTEFVTKEIHGVKMQGCFLGPRDMKIKYTFGVFPSCRWYVEYAAADYKRITGEYMLRNLASSLIDPTELRILYKQKVEWEGNIPVRTGEVDDETSIEILCSTDKCIFYENNIHLEELDMTISTHLCLGPNMGEKFQRRIVGTGNYFSFYRLDVDSVNFNYPKYSLNVVGFRGPLVPGRFTSPSNNYSNSSSQAIQNRNIRSFVDFYNLALDDFGIWSTAVLGPNGVLTVFGFGASASDLKWDADTTGYISIMSKEVLTKMDEYNEISSADSLIEVCTVALVDFTNTGLYDLDWHPQFTEFPIFVAWETEGGSYNTGVPVATTLTRTQSFLMFCYGDSCPIYDLIYPSGYRNGIIVIKRTAPICVDDESQVGVILHIPDGDHYYYRAKDIKCYPVLGTVSTVGAGRAFGLGTYTMTESLESCRSRIVDVSWLNIIIISMTYGDDSGICHGFENTHHDPLSNFIDVTKPSTSGDHLSVYCQYK